LRFIQQGSPFLDPPGGKMPFKTGFEGLDPRPGRRCSEVGVMEETQWR
jgi:hypothetical protein